MSNIQLEATVRPVNAEKLKSETLHSKDWAMKAATDFLLDRDFNFPIFNLTENFYREYLEGKSVLLVGGADGPIPQQAFDVVVRINSHLPRQGGRCDVLYHTGVGTPSINPSLLSYMPNVKFVFLNSVDGQYEVRNNKYPVYLPFVRSLRELRPKAEIGFFAQGEWMEKNPYGPEQEWLNDLHKKYNCKLFTGLTALAHIMRFNPARIFVTGMTLYVEQTHGAREGKVESHEISGNLAFITDAARDSRVVLSAELRRALDAYQL